MDRKQSVQMLGEMKLFASFSAAQQRYIRRSLDVGLMRGDALARWARTSPEAEAIEAQARRYRMLDLIRKCVPDDDAPDEAEPFLASLITLSVSDLKEGKIGSFDSYRFLYERLVGAEARPWLVSTFCAAVAQPGVHPELRKRLLQSIPVLDVIAAGWSIQPPLFYPEWVEKVPEAVS
ncbi:MAG: hypothetical protein M3Q19_09200 [Pseudomonadota bacterium]|nr:hypothetical protein [Pseudomonadota bacterium]